MNEPLKILIVAYSNDASAWIAILKDGGIKAYFERVKTAKRMQEALKARSWDAIIADIDLPRFAGLAVLEIYKDLGLEIPIIMLSTVATGETAVKIIQAGAHDYLPKENLGLLVPAITRALREAEARQERDQVFLDLQHRAQELERLYDTALITTSELEVDGLLHRLYEQVQKLIAPDSFIVALYDSSSEKIRIALAMEAGAPIPPFVGLTLPLRDGGLTGWVINQRKTLKIDDVENDPLPTEPKRSPHPTPTTRAWLGVPLIARNQIIGAVSIQSFQPGAFSDQHRRFLESLSAQAAIALENARLFEAERAAREQAETLRDVAQAVAGSWELSSVIHLILEQLKRVLAYETASVFLLGEGQLSTLVAGVGYENEAFTSQASRNLLEDSPILAQMSRDLQPVIIPDVRDHPDWIWVPGAEHVRSFLAVPVIVRQKMIGALMADTTRVDGYSDRDLNTVQAFAQHMGIAIETARLFEAERSQLLLSQTLQEVGMLLTSELGLEEVLVRLLDLLLQVVPYDSASVQMIDGDGELYLAAGHGLPDLEMATQVTREYSHQMLAMKSANLVVDVIPDTHNDPDWVIVPGLEYIHSWVGAPLLVRGRLIGFLNIDNRKVNSYNHGTGETVNAFAIQAAIVIENARLFESERAARERAEVMREAVQVIGSTLSLNQVIDVILEQLARALSYDSGCVMLIENDRVYVQAGRGYEAFPDSAAVYAIEFALATNRTISDLVRDQAPVMIPDTRLDDRWEETSISGYVRSWLGVPLHLRDQVIGLFSLDRTTPGGFSEEEVGLVQTFAAHTSAAIENARLFEAEERRAVELEALRKISLSLTASLEMQEVMDEIMDGVFRLIPDVDDAHIFLYDGQQLKYGAALWRDGRRGTVWSEPREDGLTYAVVQSGEMHVVPDMQTHPMFEKVVDEKGWGGAIIGLPLLIGDRVIGVMNIAYPQPRVFPEGELRVLSLLGDQAALAIENARLFEQTITERRHITLLYDVGQAAVTSFDPSDILQRAIVLTYQALGGIVGAAWLYHPDRNELELCALCTQVGDLLKEVEGECGDPEDLGLIGWAAINRQPVNVPDVSDDPRWVDVPYLPEIVRSTIVSPVLAGENLLGIMAVQHNHMGTFSQDHLDLLQAICQQIGLALSNARRYQDINRLVDLLAAEQYRLESLIERLPVGVLLLGEDYQLQIANPLGNELLGMLTSAKVGDVITNLSTYPLVDLVSHYADPMPVEISLDGPPGRIFEAQVRPLGSEKQQWVLMLRDVTQEREIQDRAQMQDRLATVGQLAAGIAHDFNNIMAAIVVYADLLMLEPHLSDAGIERLNTIQQQVQRAASLIRQILDFSRRSVMEQSPLDLLPFIKEIEKLLRRTLPETIHLKLEFEPGTYMVSADPTRLQQVFMNLAVNARDAMPDGGELSFALSHVHIESKDTLRSPDMHPGEWLRMVVKDTGEGIPPEPLAHIFEPFYTTKPVGHGTGLGLAQVYGIIRQHGGYIDVSSQVGVGTTFNMYLPTLTVSGDVERTSETLTQLDGKGEKVLLVEDDTATRMALQTMLDVYNYNVLIASNGEEALNVLQNEGESIVLVVSDVVMPEMGGKDLYVAMQETWSGIKMLLMTGHPLEEEDQNLLEAGKVHWLQKPFSVQEFSQAVQTLMGLSKHQ